MGVPEIWAMGVVVCCFMVVAGGFLLLGWRLGRESRGRPMFEFPGPIGAGGGGKDAFTAEEVDPWDAAMVDAPGEEFAGIER